MQDLHRSCWFSYLYYGMSQTGEQKQESVMSLRPYDVFKI